MKKSKRVVIAKDTLNILKNGFFKNAEGENIQIDNFQKAAVRDTILYTPEVLKEMIEQPFSTNTVYDTAFEVNNLTSLDSVRKEFEEDSNLVCLNFASARNPGGGFLNGSQAQEESIARATGLYPCLLKAEGYYLANRAIRTCLYTDHMIYSPQVPILKDEEGELLPKLYHSSFITAPAVNTGVVLRNEPENIEKIEPYMHKRIEMVLSICQKQGHETLILGAWGCGVFRNDPNLIAAIFKEKLIGKYKGQFKKVVFSVYSKNERFIKAFQGAFYDKIA